LAGGIDIVKMRSTLKVGDWVEVRGKEEILATLDATGRLDGMPWMPEMLQFCEKKFQVHKRAHKSCDYTTPYPYRSRWIDNAVLLDTRCDGAAHAGCQAQCTILWKEAWLKPAVGNATLHSRPASVRPAGPVDSTASGGCSEFELWSHTHVIDPADQSTTYVCQMTELLKASRPLAWWDVRQYAEDFRSGNTSLGRLFTGLIYSLYYNVSQAGIGVGPAMRWFYDKFRWMWRGSMFPRKPGTIAAGKSTPTLALNLQPGELVRVKSHEEILKTVTEDNLNRGMYWDAELVPYCGGTYRVRSRVTRLINERTGKLVEMKNPCIVLDSVVCQARYSPHRMFCPRAMFPYWREIWLERVAESRVQSVAAE
jgi:hypothetical protein